MEANRVKIREYIKKNLVLFDDDIQFADSDNIFKKGFVNSLFAMKLLRFIENEFELVVNTEDMNIKNFSSVDNIIEFIDSKIKVT